MGCPSQQYIVMLCTSTYVYAYLKHVTGQFHFTTFKDILIFPSNQHSNAVCIHNMSVRGSVLTHCMHGCMHGSMAFSLYNNSAMTACPHTGSNPQLLSVEVKLILLLRKEFQML